MTGAITKGNWCPLMFIFSPDKQGSTYEMIFDTLKHCLSDLGLELSSEYCMADFEIALRTAFSRSFPEIPMKGCHFHYGQSIWKFVMDNGQKSSFSKCIEFATHI